MKKVAFQSLEQSKRSGMMEYKMKELIKQLLDIHEIVSSMKDFAMTKFKIEELNEETEAYKLLVD